MTTTTDDLTTALRLRVQETVERAEREVKEYADLRAKVQESAWALGWQHSIGSVMEQMLDELGLEGRPHRVRVATKVRLTVRLEQGLGNAERLPDNIFNLRLRHPMELSQVRPEARGTAHLPREVGINPSNPPGCYCSVLDEHVDMAQVEKAVRENNGWGEEGVEILAVRCTGAYCENRDRTQTEATEPAPEPEPF